jgi:hypothetical protein
MAEIDASSVHTNEFSRHMGANSAENAFEQYIYCNSLEKTEAFECFRDMAAMVSEKNAILVRKNTELVNKDAALVNENILMASTTAKLQSSVETRYTDQHPLLEPMDIVDQPSDGALPSCDALSISSNTFKQIFCNLTPLLNMLRLNRNHAASNILSNPSDIRIFHGTAASFTDPSALHLLTDVESTHDLFGAHNNEPDRRPDRRLNADGKLFFSHGSSVFSLTRFDLRFAVCLEYALVSSGTCQLVGRLDVAQAGCEAAAVALGLSETTASSNSHSDRPPGCIYVHQVDSSDILRFNTDDTSETRCGSGDFNYDCICGPLEGMCHAIHCRCASHYHSCKGW